MKKINDKMVSDIFIHLTLEHFLSRHFVSIKSLGINCGLMTVLTWKCQGSQLNQTILASLAGSGLQLVFHITFSGFGNKSSVITATYQFPPMYCYWCIDHIMIFTSHFWFKFMAKIWFWKTLMKFFCVSYRILIWFLGHLRLIWERTNNSTFVGDSK